MGKMRQSNSKIIAYLLLISLVVGLTRAAGRRRMTPRPQFRSTSSRLRQRTTTTSLPSFGAVYNQRFTYRFPTPTTTISILRENSNNIVCKKSQQVIADLENPKGYKLCVSVGRNWIVYAYKCPGKTEFQQDERKCMKPKQILNYSTTEKSFETNFQFVQTKITTDASKSSDPDQTTDSTDSSSSSEEITDFPSSSTTPESYTKPLKGHYKPLLHHILKPSLPNKSKVFTKFIYGPIEKQLDPDYFNNKAKLTTWQNSELVMNQSTTLSSVISPSFELDENDNVIWESQSPVTRWKAKETTTESTYKARFPGLRPVLDKIYI